MADKVYFGPEFFQFFRELRENNDREWFKADKARYEEFVRRPCLEFISDFSSPLRSISRYYVADPRPIGGSLFRIYRDVRFSRNKSPYKTAAGMQFNHASFKSAHAPGFYLHLGPDEVYMACGVWHPESNTLRAIRDALVADPAGWRKAISGNRFRSVFTFRGDTLKRAPRGYDPDHPLIEDIKRKDFIVGTRLTEEEACSPDFMDKYTEACRIASPFLKFLTRALGLNW